MQIGLVLLIALASKSAILIVEFVRDLRLKRRREILDAAVEAARLRFRPSLMTSFAFILGVLPRVFATGAGVNAKRSIGITFASGMLASTLIAVLSVPAFFVPLQCRTACAPADARRRPERCRSRRGRGSTPGRAASRPFARLVRGTTGVDPAAGREVSRLGRLASGEADLPQMARLPDRVFGTGAPDSSRPISSSWFTQHTIRAKLHSIAGCITAQ